MLCLLKPVHWNPNGYLRPAGHLASSGYPKDYGFGHEEWNASPRMRVQIDGRWHRAFHTETVGKAAGEAPGDTLVLMYASHDGIHELVGIAAAATYIGEPGNAALRAELREQIGSSELWEDAWKTPTVKAQMGTAKELKAHWERVLHYGPTWVCPEEYFVWLTPGVQLDPWEITGKSKLLTMFSRYSRASDEVAALVLDKVPAAQRSEAWKAIRQLLGGDGDEQSEVDADVEAPDEESADIAAISADASLSETTRAALIDVRRGQGRFRTAQLRRWKRRCAVTGCGAVTVLRASHIQPWCTSNNTERLDPNNGILLSANLDALFDRWLISFDDDGRMLVADALSDADRKLMGLPRDLPAPLTSERRRYMALHREKFFKKSAS